MIIAEIGNNHEGSFKVAKNDFKTLQKADVDAVNLRHLKLKLCEYFGKKKIFQI